MPNNYEYFLIAEIGINHNGNLKIAKEMIAYAKEAGFDAVKFQKRTVEKVYTKEFLDSPREESMGKNSKGSKEGIEFNEKDYDAINEYCSQKKYSGRPQHGTLNLNSF